MSDDKAPIPGRCWYNQGLTEFPGDKTLVVGPWYYQDFNAALSPAVRMLSPGQQDSYGQGARQANQTSALEATPRRQEAQAIRRWALESALRCWQPNVTAAAVIAQAREFEAYLSENSSGAPDVL